MLLQLSKSIVSVWSKEGIVAVDHEEAYVYGVQLLLSTLGNIFCIALISTAAGCSFVWIPFLFGFVPIRVTAGGYHAKTPLQCSLVFCGIYSIGVLLMEEINGIALIPVCLLNSIAAILAVYLLSPIPAHNKPLSQTEGEKKRRISITIVSVLFLAMVVSVTVETGLEIMSYVSLGELAATILCIVAKLFQHKEKNRQCAA